jgi:hypothetical protein
MTILAKVQNCYAFDFEGYFLSQMNKLLLKLIAVHFKKDQFNLQKMVMIF